MPLLLLLQLLHCPLLLLRHQGTGIQHRLLSKQRSRVRMRPGLDKHIDVLKGAIILDIVIDQVCFLTKLLLDIVDDVLGNIDINAEVGEEFPGVRGTIVEVSTQAFLRKEEETNLISGAW